MARVQKISEKQFVLDCVNKEFELIGSPLHWDTFEELSAWSKLEENKEWYSNNAFTSIAQYRAWKDYFLTHFYDWQPKRVSKKEAEREFQWFNLQYGLGYGFDYNMLYND